jgi:hypothetical protein
MVTTNENLPEKRRGIVFKNAAAAGAIYHQGNEFNLVGHSDEVEREKDPVMYVHCKKRHLRSVPFLKQFRIFTENSGK